MAVVNLVDADGRVHTSQVTPVDRPVFEAGQTSAFSLVFPGVTGAVVRYHVPFRLQRGETIRTSIAAPASQARNLHRHEVCYARSVDRSNRSSRRGSGAHRFRLVPRVRQEPSPRPGGFSFAPRWTSSALNATVTDASGHAVTGLRAEDFIVYEDGERQAVSQFEAERVPVSLGLAVDTSGSMVGKKMSAAKAAVSRFVVDLLGARDQVFLYSFDSRRRLVQGWTDDRRAVVRSLGSIDPAGGTALYEAVAEAVPLAATGTRRKKALVVISDGNDTDSDITVGELRQLIRESEVMVYAIGIDGSGAVPRQGRRRRCPFRGRAGPAAPSSYRGRGVSLRHLAAFARARRAGSCQRRRVADDHG